KDNLRGWWSRRIDETNRIIYCEKENAIIIASCKVLIIVIDPKITEMDMLKARA
ncbi:MAG: type II toxin-antitoxin system YoeB family toxin, partial [Clostridia bacterium]|nr:type II toxin-antitoxin system YoeB family toxin [Clostridia bacterium]